MKKDATGTTNSSPPPLRGRIRRARKSTVPSPLEGEGGRRPGGGNAKSAQCTDRLTRARRLRRDQTETERKLWSALRRAQIEGVQIRRQHPIGNFVVDFFCPAATLIIELDGSPHDNETVHKRDAARTRWLEDRGYKVIRFWNEDARTNFAGVVETIRLAVRERLTPLPNPPPQEPALGPALRAGPGWGRGLGAKHQLRDND